MSAAYELSGSGVRSLVLEKESSVGGLARSLEHQGYLFDIGGHRFFTKVPIIEQMWRDVLGEDLLTRARLSRVYFRSKFFQYPLDARNALAGLGPLEALRCFASFVSAHCFPRRPERSFEDWVSNRFGRRLFDMFFRTYTEKVWGIPCDQIGAEWAAQRIRGLSLFSLIWRSLRPPKNGAQPIKTLIDQFLYPRQGPGMMWNRVQQIVESRGSRVLLEQAVDRITWQRGRVLSVTAGGEVFKARDFISSLPIRDLIQKLDPPAPRYLREAVQDFNYRDFLTVALIVRGDNLFPDNWIYIHDPGFKVGRIQNFNNWSPDLRPEADTTCLGLEYFCFENDRFWNQSDAELLELASREVTALRLVQPGAILSGAVVRVSKAYPIYDDRYERGLTAVRRFLAEETTNLQLVGRNGMHRYNNQDHSMLTGILAARNVLGADYDLWRVNVDADYLEEYGPRSDNLYAALSETQPLVPRRMSAGV